MTDTAALRAAAEAASPGPWKAQTEGHYDQKHAAARAYDEVRKRFEPDVPDAQWSDLSFVLTPDETLNVAMTGNGPKSWHNAAYIALASPDRILGILSELERKTAALEWLLTTLMDIEHAAFLRDVPGSLIARARAALEGKPTE